MHCILKQKQAAESGCAPSSSRVYLMKSFFSTRMRIVARKPVSSSTVTQELMMENQWICTAWLGSELQSRQETSVTLQHAVVSSAAMQRLWISDMAVPAGMLTPQQA